MIGILRCLDKINEDKDPNFRVGIYIFEEQKRGTKMRYKRAGPYAIEASIENKLAVELIFEHFMTDIHLWIPVSRLKKAKFHDADNTRRAHT